MVEACCIRKYEGNKHHYTQQFPKTANMISLDERKGLRVLDKRSKAIEIANSRIKNLSLPNPFRYSGPVKAAHAFITKHGLGRGYVAVHWRSEKQGYKDRLWKDVPGWTANALNRIRASLLDCTTDDESATTTKALNRVFLAVDFFEFGSQSTDERKEGDHRKILMDIYKKIEDEFEVIKFDAKVDYPHAFEAQNGMAIAAAEMTIMSMASRFVPLVKAGSFVIQVETERKHPDYTLDLRDGAAPACTDN